MNHPFRLGKNLTGGAASFRSILLLLAGLGAVAFAGAQTAETPEERGAWSSFSDLVDRMPIVLANHLPGLDPNGAVRIFSQPHVSDFFHGDYVRVPGGIRAKLTENIEANAELLGYFARDGDTPTQYGLAMLRLGTKYETVLSARKSIALSVGFDFWTPLAQAPRQFTDGYRHFQPYVTTTYMLVPDWGLLNYTTFGMNFLEHTARPKNFGRNQLHHNLTAVADGVTRQWKHLQLSLTARYATTALLNSVSQHNFSLRPEISLPWKMRPSARTQVFFTVDGRVIWGPDGRQVTTSSGIRLQFNFDRDRPAAHVL
jgi:hypothetical protein